MALYLGCPQWSLKEWVGSFFPANTPADRFLYEYSHRLNMVEGNTTFYAAAPRELIQRWRDETPDGFHFCLKFPKRISHEKQLVDCVEETDEWVSLLRLLGDRAGVSFLQLPPTFGPDRMPVLAKYLATLPTDLPFAVEARHPGWFEARAGERLDQLLTDRRIARVIYDIRGLSSADPVDPAVKRAQDHKPRVPLHVVRTAPFTLVRFISHPEVLANTGLLDEWARQVAGWLGEGLDVSFTMHNKDDVKAPALCCELHRRVARLTPLPPMPVWHTPATVKQLSLFD